MTAINLGRALCALALFVTAGCASNMKEKIVRNSLIAGAVGAAYGSTYQDYPGAHQVMFGSMFAAAAALASVYYYDPDKDSDEIKKENQFLKSQLDQFQKPTLIEQGNSLFKSQVPGPLTKLVRLGEWKHYKLDQWIQDQGNPNLWFRQVESFEIIPPSTSN